MKDLNNNFFKYFRYYSLKGLLILVLSSLVILITTCKKEENKDDINNNNSNNNQQQTIKITGININSSSASGIIEITGSNFGNLRNTLIRFSDGKNYIAEVPVLKGGTKSLMVAVPPYFNQATGKYGAGLVSLQVVEKAGSVTYISNKIEGFTIQDLPQAMSLPGTVSLAYIGGVIEYYDSLLDVLKQKGPDFEELSKAVDGNLNNLVFIGTEIYKVNSQQSGSYNFGTIKGKDLVIDIKMLSELDRYLLAFLRNLSNSEIPDSLTDYKKVYKTTKALLAKAPCSQEASSYTDYLLSLDIEQGRASNYYTQYSDCVANNNVQGIITGHKVLIAAGSSALSILTLAGASASALAVASGALFYEMVMSAGTQIAIAGGLKNVNNEAAYLALHNGVDQVEDMFKDFLTGKLIPESAGAVKSLFSGLKTLSQTFIGSSSYGSNCTYSFSSNNQTFDLKGGGGSFSVITDDGCKWSAYSNVDWVLITSGSLGTGSGTIVFLVNKNMNYKPREAIINVNKNYFKITQSGNTSVVLYEGGPYLAKGTRISQGCTQEFTFQMDVEVSFDGSQYTLSIPTDYWREIVSGQCSLAGITEDFNIFECPLKLNNNMLSGTSNAIFKSGGASFDANLLFQSTISVGQSIKGTLTITSALINQTLNITLIKQ